MPSSGSIKYIGVNDYQIKLFERQFPVPNGMAYNSYLILDEKIAVVDTVDFSCHKMWLENLDRELNGMTPDYLIILHMEPDHSGSLKCFLDKYPTTQIIGNEKIFKMIEQFFHINIIDKIINVLDRDVVSLGNHQLEFIFAPMVHWPEVMMMYDYYEKALFSADAFGKFGVNEVKDDWLEEARRYYFSIVAKYNNQIQELLSKLKGYEINTIYSLHGPILDNNIGYYLAYYDKWSKFESENDDILIIYTSIYGNTKDAINYLIDILKEKEVSYESIDLVDVDIYYAVAKAFQYKKIILATTTYNNGLFPKMDDFINRLVERNFQNKIIGFIENGSWNPNAKNKMSAKLVDLDLSYLENSVTIYSSMTETNKEEIKKLAVEIINKRNDIMDLKALQKIEYGLYVVTCNDGIKDNGLILNTVFQLTMDPVCVGVSINKDNYSHDVILRTNQLNVSLLDTTTPFSLIEQFGFKSGRDTNKFEGKVSKHSSNGLIYLDQHSNAYLSLKVNDVIDLGTHSLFMCSLEEAKVLNDKPSLSYSYYLEHVKPNPKQTSKKGYVCTICGFVYEGEELPEGYVCPLCLHGTDYFEPIE